MARKRSKDTPLQGEVTMSGDAPDIGQKVYYIDHRGTAGVLTATITNMSSDGCAELSVYDLNVTGGSFTVMASEHDEAMSPGTWHYPK